MKVKVYFIKEVENCCYCPYFREIEDNNDWYSTGTITRICQRNHMTIERRGIGKYCPFKKPTKKVRKRGKTN